MQRPPPASQPARPADNSQVEAVAETIFLLSIARDEDDAATIRADLKRSLLGPYKLQHCARLDDAASLLRVCAFDAAIARLDDFHDAAAAVARLRALDADLPVIGVASARALARPDFARPQGLETLLRAEDLSPSLLELAVRSTLASRREARQRLRLRQEFQLALEAGELGRWSYDAEEDLLDLDPIASALLGFPAARLVLPLDKAIDNATRESKAAAKSAFQNAAQSASPLQCVLALEAAAKPPPRLQFSGRAEERPRASPGRLFGVIRQADTADEARALVSQARAVVEDALRGSEATLERARSHLSSLARSLPEAPTARAPEPSPRREPPADRPLPPPPLSTPIGAELGIDTQTAFQNVLRSLARQQPGDDANARRVTFPFDFSGDSNLDYTEPDPAAEGFVGAAKRLVSITQRGHGLRVSMSVDEPAAIEAEIEKEMIFDILRELLTNVVKHAKASLCIISLFRDEDEWVLQVEDDGLGLGNGLVSVSTPLNQIGLFRIRTQLALKGGHLDIAPSSPSGLIARCRLPVTLRRSHPQSEAERA